MMYFNPWSKQNNCKTRLLYAIKLSYSIKWEIDLFHEKQKETEN
jgi:hypothetical protein